MKKVIIILSVLFLLFMVYLVSKYLWFNYNEDLYYSSNVTDYESVVDHITKVPELREIKPTYRGSYIDTSLLDIKLKLPFNRETDSIDLKLLDNKALVGGIVNEDLSKSKSILFLINKDDVASKVKQEILGIDRTIDTLDTYNVYDKIFSHKPKMNILKDSYAKIKYELRLSHLKSVVMVNGGDKKLYKYTENAFNAFQFCEPNICKAVSVSLFIDNQDLLMTFKNFTQDEIDFVLSSLEKESS